MSILSSFKVLFILTVLWGNALFGSPFVTQINPTVGPSSGGTMVTITGSGFRDVNAINFGSTPAAAFTVESDSFIRATSPAHVPQVVAITVTTTEGTSPSTRDSFFTYQGFWQLYASNLFNNTVTIINTADNTVLVENLAVGPNPAGIALTPDGSKAYVVNNGGNTVSVINAATLSEELPVITVGTQPTGIAITPDGTKAFVSNFQSNTVSIIDTSNDTIITTVDVGTGPLSIAITPDGTKAYVGNLRSDDISVIDTNDFHIITTIPGVSGPRGLIISPDGTKAYVSNFFGASVTVINTANNTIITEITIDSSNLEGICITPDGTKVYVVDGNNPFVYAINAINDTFQTQIEVEPGNHLSIATTSDGTKVYVPNVTNNSVSVIATNTDTIIATIPGKAGGNLFSLAITPDSSTAYVGDFLNDIELAIKNNAIDAMIPTGIFPSGAAITPDQAPLSKFSFKLAPLGRPSTFDATSSVSPVGVIVNYFWDFGDGTTLNTSNPIVKHTYTAPGTFTVTLIVTNSAGTSTTQLSTPSSVPAMISDFLVSNDIAITHNGGPTALSTQTFSIFLPFPVQNICGQQVERKCGCHVQRDNILRWTSPNKGSIPRAFLIFRDAALTELIADIPASGKLIFVDRNPKKGRAYVYFIVTVDQIGNFSEPAKIVVRPKHCR